MLSSSSRLKYCLVVEELSLLLWLLRDNNMAAGSATLTPICTKRLTLPRLAEETYI